MEKASIRKEFIILFSIKHVTNVTKRGRKDSKSSSMKNSIEEKSARIKRKIKSIELKIFWFWFLQNWFVKTGESKAENTKHDVCQSLSCYLFICLICKLWYVFLKDLSKGSHYLFLEIQTKEPLRKSRPFCFFVGEFNESEVKRETNSKRKGRVPRSIGRVNLQEKKLEKIARNLKQTTKSKWKESSSFETLACFALETSS